MPRLATYHRCSTLDQNPGLARDELRAAAARLGGDVVLDVEETGSGSRNDRPGLARVMEAARRGKLDAVLVWKLDRFGRSALDLLANIRHLDSCGVRFMAVTQGIDVRPGGDAMSRLLVTMLAAVAEFERDLIRERTRLGLANARASGAKLGRPAGSTRNRPTMEQVQQLRAGGHSWSGIAKALRCSASTARRAMMPSPSPDDARPVSLRGRRRAKHVDMPRHDGGILPALRAHVCSEHGCDDHAPEGGHFYEVKPR